MLQWAEESFSTGPCSRSDSQRLWANRGAALANAIPSVLTARDRARVHAEGLRPAVGGAGADEGHVHRDSGAALPLAVGDGKDPPCVRAGRLQRGDVAELLGATAEAAESLEVPLPGIHGHGDLDTEHCPATQTAGDEAQVADVGTTVVVVDVAGVDGRPAAGFTRRSPCAVLRLERISPPELKWLG